jgi:hypothetical protein
MLLFDSHQQPCTERPAEHIVFLVQEDAASCSACDEEVGIIPVHQSKPHEDVTTQGPAMLLVTPGMLLKHGMGL